MGVGIYFWRLLRKRRHERMLAWRCRSREGSKRWVMGLRQREGRPPGERGALTEGGGSVGRDAGDQ